IPIMLIVAWGWFVANARYALTDRRAVALYGRGPLSISSSIELVDGVIERPTTVSTGPSGTVRFISTMGGQEARRLRFIGLDEADAVCSLAQDAQEKLLAEQEKEWHEDLPN